MIEIENDDGKYIEKKRKTRMHQHNITSQNIYCKWKNNSLVAIFTEYIELKYIERLRFTYNNRRK